MFLRLALCSLLLCDLALAKDPPLPEKIYDFTKGATLPEGSSHDWTLGPIGARGWAQVGGPGNAGTTAKSRQILITRVDAQGPAKGVLAVGDVILGIGNTPFANDARITLAKALSTAEVEGKLTLLRFREGSTESITLNLSKLPPLAETAPYRCRKSRDILQAGCEALAERGLKNPSIDSHLNALALLASGDPRYHSLLKDFARKSIARPLSPDISLPCWHFSFANIFLCEYYLVTGDSQVLPEITRLTGNLVSGQGPLGTWGHSFVNPSSDRLQGYGAVNAVGVPAAISLVLAKECGIELSGLEESITLSATFFRRHVGLGAIPYGDGPPNLEYGHDDNGKNSAAALFFNLLGDQAAADYYTCTALAAFGSDREQGHTGNFFNMLWSLPAVSLAGPQATGAWLQEFGWYYDLARDPEYRFPYQGYPRERANSAHSSWNCPGAYLLHYALPLQKIRLTGRGRTVVEPFSKEKIAACLAAGKFRAHDASEAELTAALASWSPVVRRAAAKEARQRGVSQPPSNLGSANPLERVAALRLSKDYKSSLRGLEDGDLRVRLTALEQLARLNKEQAIGDLFSHLAKNPDESPVFTQQIGNTFFPLSIRPAAVEKLLLAPKDRPATIAAIEILLNDEDSLVSSRIAMGLSALPSDELEVLLPLIYRRALTPPVGNVMFANKLQTSCAAVLAKLRVQEGLETSAALLCDSSWGKQNRLPIAASLVLGYEGHAKTYLPQMREALSAYKNAGDKKWKTLLIDTIEVVEGFPTPQESLPSIQRD